MLDAQQNRKSLARSEARPRTMHEIMALRDQRQQTLFEHPFFEWLNSETVPLDRKFEIMPALTSFVMNFRDMNLWVIRFDDSHDEYKEIINGSTVEDETHSRLFLEDWRKLHLDDHTLWQASDVLWWLFLAEEMEPFRHYAAEFVRLCVDDGGDPLVRFAHSEAAEACGNVFFTFSAPLAERLGQARGLQYRYFGQFHLDLETGHVLESEHVFQNARLTEAQYQLGVELLERVFRIFHGVYDTFLNYAKRYVESAEVPRHQLQVHYTDLGNEASSVQMAVSAQFDWVHPSQQSLQDHLQQRLVEAASHPFYVWLQSSPLPALKRLQRFIVLWAFDALAYRDLNKYYLRYSDPRSPLEHSLNQVTETLEAHSQLFLQDWQELGLDSVLRWPASDALGFYFLDPVCDIHRETLVRFGLAVFKHPDAFERLWFVEALEATGYAFFANTREVALQAEQEAGIRLDYLADRHASVNPNPTGAIVNFKALAIENTESLARCRKLIDLVFDALARNLSLSLAAAEQNKLAVR